MGNFLFTGVFPRGDKHSERNVVRAFKRWLRGEGIKISYPSLEGSEGLRRHFHCVITCDCFDGLLLSVRSRKKWRELCGDTYLATSVRRLSDYAHGHYVGRWLRPKYATGGAGSMLSSLAALTAVMHGFGIIRRQLQRKKEVCR